MTARVLFISFLSLLGSPLGSPLGRGSIPTSTEAELPGLEPAIAATARWAVAIQVDREPEQPQIPRPRGPTFRIQPDLADYFRRPPGPATGLLLDRKGNVLTSHYNISGKLKSIEVVLPGGVRRSARLVASDRSDDLALLRLDDPPSDLEVPDVKWADPDKLQVGKVVIAVGRSPDPARPTATFGIVSALGRNGGRAFQTDAELNYGNVGGPITDLDGAVVGLAGFVGHRYLWGLNSGIGFGTSSRTIREVLPRLLSGETVPPPERPFLGVGMSDHFAPGMEGVLLGSVEPDSPAQRAGLRPNDVVLLFSGEKVEDFLDLKRQISRRRPGDQAVLKVRRGTEELEVKVQVGRRPD
jgi:S1-C subfamily serine protease